MLKQSQCQHILHAHNLCTECTVPTFLQAYCWCTALRTPNTSHPLHHPFLGCHVFFLDVLGFFFLSFLGCLLPLLLPSANLFGFSFCFFSCLLSSSPMASFSGVSVKIVVVPLGCTTVTTCPCKIGTINPRPPYLTKHACSNIPT